MVTVHCGIFPMTLHFITGGASAAAGKTTASADESVSGATTAKPTKLRHRKHAYPLRSHSLCF